MIPLHSTKSLESSNGLYEVGELFKTIESMSHLYLDNIVLPLLLNVCLEIVIFYYVVVVHYH